MVHGYIDFRGAGELHPPAVLGFADGDVFEEDLPDDAETFIGCVIIDIEIARVRPEMVEGVFGLGRDGVGVVDRDAKLAVALEGAGAGLSPLPSILAALAHSGGGSSFGMSRSQRSSRASRITVGLTRSLAALPSVSGWT